MYGLLGIPYAAYQIQRPSCIAAGNSESLRIGQHHIVIYRNTRSRGRNLQCNASTDQPRIRSYALLQVTSPCTRSPSHWVRPYALGMFARRMILVFDTNELELLSRNLPVMIVTNFPHNPTGHFPLPRRGV